jgi:quinol monooxygenase YgiN
MKKINALLMSGISLLVFSCGSPKEEKKESEAAGNAVIEKIIMIKHPVAEYNAWLSAYNAHDSVRKAYGISSYLLGRGMEDSNVVYVLDKADDIQKAKEFAGLPDLKDAMQKAGVTGAPEFHYMNVLRDDNSPIEIKDRVMVMHKVKDFDAWLKVYDQEGMETRKANGLIDRGIARDADDPNMVYIVFAIADMEKAKARVNSEELKKLMMDAGVEGPPTTYFYRIAM